MIIYEYITACYRILHCKGRLMWYALVVTREKLSTSRSVYSTQYICLLIYICLYYSQLHVSLYYRLSKQLKVLRLSQYMSVVSVVISGWIRRLISDTGIYVWFKLLVVICYRCLEVVAQIYQLVNSYYTAAAAAAGSDQCLYKYKCTCIKLCYLVPFSFSYNGN